MVFSGGLLGSPGGAWEVHGGVPGAPGRPGRPVRKNKSNELAGAFLENSGYVGRSGHGEGSNTELLPPPCPVLPTWPGFSQNAPPN